MTLENVIIIGYIINIILIITMIFFERRDPAVSMAWVFCFATLPVLGLIIFIVFGLGLKAHTKRRYRQKQELNNNILSTFIKEEKIKSEHRPEICKNYNIYKYLRSSAQSICTYDNEVKILTSAEEKYYLLLKDIENAKSSVNMLYFIIHDDEIGRKILDTLEKKANEGVEVRFLYDGFGSILTPRRVFSKLKKCPNAHVAEFFPVRLFSFSKLNHRNHRKIAVIDGKIAYLGGMNIGDEYMSRKKLKWRDTHMRITGSAVNDIQRYFALDWEFSTDERLTNRLDEFFPHTAYFSDNGVPIQIVASGPDSPAEEIKCALIQMIYNARKYVYLQTPYFVPDQAFLTAITSAAESGIDVRVMIPGTPDKRYVYYTTMSYVRELIAAGVKVYLYSGFIHSKCMIVDNEITTIGTTNIDIRSFQLHFELNAFMYDERICCECCEIFMRDLKKSVEMTAEKYNNRGIKNVMFEGFFRLFSSIM